MRSFHAIAAPVLAVAMMAGPALADEPIRIGVLTSLSGTLAPVGQQVQWGIELAADELNADGGILGRQVELLVDDDESNPQVAARRGERLLQQEQVDFITGSIHSGATLALAQLAEREERLAATTVSYSSNITGEMCSENMFRVNAHAGIQAAALTTWMAENIEATRYAIIAPDYVMGKDAGENFDRGVRAHGGDVVALIEPPLGARDFSTYFSQLRSARPEVLLTMTPGTDTVRLMTQLQEFGFLSGDMVVGGASGAVTRGNIGSLEGAAEGFLTAADYSPEVDSDESRRFVEAFRAKFDDEPDLFALNSYSLLFLLRKAAEEAGSFDAEPLRAAMRGMEWDTPAGRRTMRAEDHQAAVDMYVIRVEGTDFSIIDKVEAADIPLEDLCDRF